jgi:hypothetical protein
MKLKTHSTLTTASAACLCAFALLSSMAMATTPAEAQDYPYCLTSPGYGYPGECSYSSYAQCRASASGRRADCVINPRVAFRESRRRDYRTYGNGW